MSRRLSQRSALPEHMDDFSQGGAELREALRHLRWLNRIFGASGPVVYGVNYLWEQAGRPSRLTVLDVGSGSGDLNRSVLKWAKRRGVQLRVILSDVTSEAEAEAARLFEGDPRVAFARRSAFSFGPNEADIVMASQFVHHFDPEQLPGLVRRLLATARIGVVINDIHRHWIPWTAVWIVTRLISANRYIRHDGPLSVAKGFRRRDLRSLAQQLDGAETAIRWRPLFRYAVLIAKRRRDDG